MDTRSNLNNRTDRNNTAYIIGGVMVLAVILAFLFMGADDRDDISTTAPAAGNMETNIPATENTR